MRSHAGLIDPYKPRPCVTAAPAQNPPTPPEHNDDLTRSGPRGRFCLDARNSCTSTRNNMGTSSLRDGRAARNSSADTRNDRCATTGSIDPGGTRAALRRCSSIAAHARSQPNWLGAARLWAIAQADAGRRAPPGTIRQGVGVRPTRPAGLALSSRRPTDAMCAGNRVYQTPTPHART